MLIAFGRRLFLRQTRAALDLQRVYRGHRSRTAQIVFFAVLAEKNKRIAFYEKAAQARLQVQACARGYLARRTPFFRSRNGGAHCAGMGRSSEKGGSFFFLKCHSLPCVFVLDVFLTQWFS